MKLFWKLLLLGGLIAAALLISPLFWWLIGALITYKVSMTIIETDWKEMPKAKLGLIIALAILTPFFAVLFWLSFKYNSVAFLIIAWWAVIGILISGFSFGLYYAADYAAKKDRVLTYLKTNVIKYVVQGDDLKEILNGARDRDVDQETGEFIPMEQGFIATYSGFFWKFMRALWFGLFPNHKILTWTEAFNREDLEEKQHPLALRHQATKKEEAKTELEIYRTITLIPEGVELEDNLAIDLAVQFDLEMINAWIPVWKWLPHGNYAKRISGAVNDTLQDYLGQKGSKFEDLVKRRHSLRGSKGKDMFQIMFEPFSLAKNAVAGFVMKNFRLLDFDVSLDEESQKSLRAIRAKAIRIREGEGEAAFLGYIKEVSKDWPEFVRYKFSEAAQNWTAVSLGKDGIISLN